MDFVQEEQEDDSTNSSSNYYRTITPLALNNLVEQRQELLTRVDLIPDSQVNYSGKQEVIDLTKVYDGPRQPLRKPQWVIQPKPGKVGGRLSQYSPNWRFITTDKWVLSTVTQGLTWKWINDQPPTLSTKPIDIARKSDRYSQIYDKAIAKDLQDGIIEVTKHPETPGYYNLYWLKIKPDKDEEGNQKYRRLLDLSTLNTFIDKKKFKMETAESVRECMKPNEYATSIDFTDAYFHIMVAIHFRKYLRFMYKGVVYNLCVMPQGINIAPFVFTAVIKPIKQYCHLRGIEVYQYIDDWLVKHKDFKVAKEQTEFIIYIAEGCGFIKSETKCELIPKQQFEFLGYVFDTVRFVVYPPQKRWDSLIPMIESFQKSNFLIAHKWQILVGKLVALTKMVPSGMLHLRDIQYHLHRHWRMAYETNQKRVPITKQVLKQIVWWKNREGLQQGVPMVGKQHEVTMYTDASDTGFGGHVGNHMFKGTWNQSERRLHINAKELLAVFHSIRYFYRLLTDRHVLIATDNTTVIAYINKQGGTRSKTLWRMTHYLYQWCSQHNIILSAKHIPGTMNILADSLSREDSISNLEWSLNWIVVRQIWNIWGEPHIDLFSNWTNAKCHDYVSGIPDPEAYGVNAFNISWAGAYVYAFPPFAVLARVLSKFIAEGDTMILIAPHSTERTWYPMLLSVLGKPPLKLPNMRKLLRQKSYSLHNKHKLHAWYLSTNVKTIRQYRQTLGKSYRYSPYGYIEGGSIGSNLLQW